MIVGHITSVRDSGSGTVCRAIALLAAQGHEARPRVLLAGAPAVSADASGGAGEHRTDLTLATGAKAVAVALGAALRRPLAFVSALRLSGRVERDARRGVLGRLGRVAEACLLERWCRRYRVEHLYAPAATPPAEVAMLTCLLGGPPCSFTAQDGSACAAPEPQALQYPALSGAERSLPDPGAATRASTGYDTSHPLAVQGRIARWAGANVWRATDRAARNRVELYGGAAGLRIVIFHFTPREQLDDVRRVVEWWQERRRMAAPEDVDELVAGRLGLNGQDRLLVTFDDGLAHHHEAAAWLADVGIRAVFFVIPSLLDRTVAQFSRYHADRGVQAFPPLADGDTPGLSSSQVREMLAMGHRIGAHNFAHRDMGTLRDTASLRYEIDEAVERVAELTGSPCEDFAIGFGQPENLSPEAAEHIRRRCPKVYMCHRGLNVPGHTSRFLLRHAHELGHPFSFTQVCLDGGGDHRLAGRMLAMRARVGRLPPGPAHVAGAPLEAPAALIERR